MYACVTSHLHFWQNDRGILRATVVTWGWNGHQIRVGIQSLLWRRKFSCHSCWDSNFQPFDHKSGALTNKLFRYKITDNENMQVKILTQSTALWIMKYESQTAEMCESQCIITSTRGGISITNAVKVNVRKS